MCCSIRTVAISCVYSSVCSAQEKRAAEVVRQELGPDAYVSCGSELGRLGLCERENTVIINAALRELAEKTISSFETGLGDVLGPQAVTPPEMFLTQNDGTLMPLGLARVLPVLTFASGPTNSMRGAAFLTGFRDAVVVDVGGTTSDAGLLSKGFPLERALDARIGGVRTNFRLPDVHSIGLGGGSRIHEHDDGSVTVGLSFFFSSRIRSLIYISFTTDFAE